MSTKEEVKRLAQTIESLAKDMQTALFNDFNHLETANELAKANVLFMFALGGLHAQPMVSEPAQKQTTPDAFDWHAIHGQLKDSLVDLGLADPSIPLTIDQDFKLFTTPMLTLNKKSPRVSNPNFHNVRDNKGRFAKK